MENIRHTWSREDLREVLELYPRVKNAIHERNPAIATLAAKLGKGVRGTEAQLLMFRSLERNGGYSWGKMNRLVRELWEQHHGAEKLPELTFERLQLRSFGGENVAAQPDVRDESWWPRAPINVDVEAMIGAAAQATKTPLGLSVYFLLGGAGNGKSFAARSLLEVLGKEVKGDPFLANRSYRLELPECDLVILNDATIAQTTEYGQEQSTALARDLTAWVTQSRIKPIVAFCCVNRGIIVDELRHLPPDHRLHLARGILEWLAEIPSSSIALSAGKIEGQPEHDDGKLELDIKTDEGLPLRLKSLSVDRFSLLEPKTTTPRCYLTGSQELRAASPAAQLLSQVLEATKLEASSRPSGCPLRANATQLANTIPIWAHLLRTSEVASGRLLSYRDIWGLIALSVLGPREPDSTVAHIDGLLARSKKAEERVEALLSLAAHRTHQSLFRAPGLSLEQDPRIPPGFPAARGLMLIDPSAHRTADTASVEAAMMALSVGDRPSVRLRVLIPQFEKVWSQFDEELEEAVLGVAALPGCPEPRRRRLSSWLGSYMYRLTGMATGNWGYAEVFEMWQSCLDGVSRDERSLPHKLGRAFRGLLFPRFGTDATDQNVYVRAFATTTEPVRALREDLGDVLLDSVDPSSLDLRAACSGDKLKLQVCIAADIRRTIAETSLDFALIREALLWADGQPGISESTRHVEPRLERIRAASLNALKGHGRRFILAAGELKELA